MAVELKQYPMTPEEKAALDDLSEEGLAKMAVHVEGLIARGNVTSEEMSKIRLNTDRYRRILTVLTMEAFIERHAYCAANCCADPRGVTYNDALATHYAREVQSRMTLLVWRVRDAEDVNEKLALRLKEQRERAERLEASLSALEKKVVEDAAERAQKPGYWR